ncbi:MAG: GDSL-type esterase/lipase family protein [Polyangiales bacterium]
MPPRWVPRLRARAEAIPFLDDPCLDAACAARALDAFAARLARDARARAVTRVLHVGDSLIADDRITGRLRRRLQRELGDGGLGFVFLRPTARSYHPAGVRFDARGWYPGSVVGPRWPDARYGLGATGFEAPDSGPHATLTFDRGRAFTVLVQPDPAGGALSVRLDDGPAQTVRATTTLRAASDAPHAVTVRAAGGKVRVFGVVATRDGPGITVENLGTVSNSARALLHQSEASWRDALREADPALVLLSLGTNEASHGALPPADRAALEVDAAALYRRVREALPGASCLVTAPLDTATLVDGAARTRPALPHPPRAGRRRARRRLRVLRRPRVDGRPGIHHPLARPGPRRRRPHAPHRRGGRAPGRRPRRHPAPRARRARPGGLPVTRLAVLTVWVLGCAAAPLPAVGVAAPPGRNRTEGAPRVIAARPAPPPEHAPSDPIPRFDDPVPRPPDAPAPPDDPPAPQGVAPSGELWEDPSGRASAFVQAVRARTTPLTVLQLGDSHTEGDAWTSALRRALARRLGDGGRGFVPVAGGQRDVARTLEGPWRVVRSALRGTDGPTGIGLARVEASSPAATLRVATVADGAVGRTASRVTVFYRTDPAGGSFTLRIDDAAAQTVSTRAGAEVSVSVTEGPHAVRVSPAGDGPVGIFGVALDRDARGARVESAGLVGAQVVHLAREHWPTLAAQITARAPTLVVLAYGTNESVAARRDPALYAVALTEVITRVRAAAPEAAVAVVGPPDTAVRAGPGAYAPAPRLDEIIAAGREVARTQGALYVDLCALMRARGGVQGWVDARPPLAEPDHVHLTRRGYEVLAEAMTEALLPLPAPAPRPLDATPGLL